MPLSLDTWSLAALMLAALLLVMLALKLRARLALSRAKHRSLAGHARLSRRIAALVPRYAFDDADFFAADDAPAEIADRRRAAFEDLSRRSATNSVRTLDRTAEAATHLSDLQFTERYRVPFPFSPTVKTASARRLVPRRVERRAGHRSRRQRLLRPHRLLWREPAGLRFLQGVPGARRPARQCARPGAGRLSVAGRRQRGAPRPHLRQAGDLVPHVGDGSGHAGRAPGALPHAALPSRALLRRLSRLVGRRSARRRQPGAGRRHLHARRKCPTPPWPC